PARPPPAPPFPYPTPFRSARKGDLQYARSGCRWRQLEHIARTDGRLAPWLVLGAGNTTAVQPNSQDVLRGGNQEVQRLAGRQVEDRKSTRLNSSHVKISYA